MKRVRLFFLLLPLVLLLLVNVLPAYATTWIDQSPSNLGYINYLHAVDAISSSDVWAVGFTCNSCTYNSPLTYHYNGTSWSNGTVTIPSGGIDFSLRGVYAVDSTDVWVAGDYSAGGLRHPCVEKWNGTSWTIKYNPTITASMQLYGITGTSNSDIWIAGYKGGSTHPFVTHYDGTGWTEATLPSYSGGTDFQVFGIASASTSDVMAVGSYGMSGVPIALAMHYDGTSWTDSSPVQNGTDSNELRGVTFIPGSASHYWAVGEQGDSNGIETLAEKWNGTSWSVVSTPTIGNDSYLYGVSATQGSNVVAVGFSFNSLQKQQTIIEKYNGTSWSTQTSVNPGGSSYHNALEGVSALDSTHTWAVGAYQDSNFTGNWTSLIEFGS